MDDLDLLKKDWQKQDSFQQVSEKDIYDMLHKKSSSIVKWLLIISVLEFIFWTILNLVADTDNYFKDDSQKMIIDVLEYISYAIILIFILLLYRNYRKISVVGSTKQLMIDILNTKKIINYYVIYNLVMIVVAILASTTYIFIYNPDNELLRQKLGSSPKMMFGFAVTIIGCTAIFIGIIWLFYRLLYGILLKKLYVNYEELKKIDL